MTTINDKINRAKELIAQREAIDTELAELFNGGGAVPRRTITCSICGGEGHTARKCPNKEKTAAAPETSATPKSTMQF
jgi:hypothetical protein